MAPALGIVGWSGSGKTTLLTALIPALRARGLRISSIKHAHHDLPLDKPGKDSARHAEAGAEEVILVSARGYALFSYQKEAALPDLLARLQPADLVLVEGFKGYEIPKLEVHRPSLGKPPLWPSMDVIAVAADEKLPDCPVPVLDLGDARGVADFLISALGLNEAA
ncbi:MAG TPA: molybdopterin-guanine dinucleotide biosynthesis protein B [Acidocella sp.]|jgi:molybdopterin-guanine dinucleotide biosynthesis protein B|nr:molybdopterin-guanine dinucleotide biosynthesis protein B [Acidocella sp.]